MKRIISMLVILLLIAVLPVTCYAQTVTDLNYTLRANGSAADHEYVLIIVNGEQASLNLTDEGDNILFIHQLTATGNSLSFDQVIPIPFEKATAFVISDEGVVLKRMVLGDTDSILALPAALKEIEEEAFQSSNAGHVILPEGCETIGTKAFSDNKSLLIAEIPSSVTQIEDDVFSGTPNVTIVSNPGSYATQWAVEHGFTFAAKTGVSPEYGEIIASLDENDEIIISEEELPVGAGDEEGVILQ